MALVGVDKHKNVKFLFGNLPNNLIDFLKNALEPNITLLKLWQRPDIQDKLQQKYFATFVVETPN